MTTTTQMGPRGPIHDEHRVEPEAEPSCRVQAVIDFERAIVEFSRVILAGDVEHVRTMTAFVDNLTGVTS
jgi:hypothetical protein